MSESASSSEDDRLVIQSILASPPAAQGPASGGPTLAVESATSTSGGPPGGGPPDSAGLHQGLSGNVIWANKYFYIKGNKLDLKMHIYERFKAEAALGKEQRTKTITPETIGEARASPTRTLLCLKAWMLWRVKWNIAWVESVPARQRLFEEEERQLCMEIRALQPTHDGLLGNDKAGSFLKDWVPDIVQQLQDS